MEHNIEDLFQIEMSPKLRDDLRTTANWAKIIATVGFVSLFFSLMVNISQGAFGSAFVSTAFYVLLYIFLLKFGTLTKKGTDDNDQDSLNDGLLNLRTYFKILAWVMIIAAAVCVVFFCWSILKQF